MKAIKLVKETINKKALDNLTEAVKTTISVKSKKNKKQVEHHIRLKTSTVIMQSTEVKL